MEDERKASLTSDLYFLIQKFLSAGFLKKTLQVFNQELEENNILPKRIDWEGNEHDRTVDDMIKQFPDIRPDFLLHLCYEATKGTSKNNLVTSFLSFRANVSNEKKVISNFKQYFNYLTRYHGVPIQPTNSSFNIVNSLRGAETSGPFSRQKAITPNLYASLQVQRTTLGHLSAVYCLLFDHSGQFIITGADDLLIKLWSTYTGRLIHSFRGASSEITDIALNSENTLLAAGSIDRILRVWSIQTGAPIAVLTGHTGMITSVNFCPTPSWGMRYLISTSTDGCVAFWAYTYDSSVKVEFRNTPILYQEKIRPGQAQMICSSFSPGGTFLATGSADHHVRVYYMKGDEGPHRILEMEAHSDRVDSIQWAHAGLKFLSGSKDGMAIIWWFERQQWKSIHLDMTTKLPNAKNTAEADTLKKLKVTMVCWNKSDEWVVTAVSDHTLKIWTAGKGQLEKVLPGHSDEIYVLEAHPHDNSIILSAGHDGQLFVWDIMKGEIVFRFLNTIEGQGYGAIFDSKWSPNGCVISASDSHGHILTFGFGSGSEFYEQLPRELFFHTDYRPLVRDTNHWVLDEQTQIPPHLMPPPFLVDIDGNPYPPMLQRLVPGRELCNVEQLVPNIVIGNEGTQEVIQDIPQNHVIDYDENDEDDEPRGLGAIYRLGRRNNVRIRHSTGDWQSDPNMEWKRIILVPLLNKSVLERTREVRECMKDNEMEEYQKQLRQRPHMISINTSSNIKKREDKKKKDTRPKRTPKPKYNYKEDEPEDEPESSGNFSESSGYSDWMAEARSREQPKRSRRRQATSNHVASSDQEDEDDVDNDEDDEDDNEDDDEESFTSDYDINEPRTSKDIPNGRTKVNGRKKRKNKGNNKGSGNINKENFTNHINKNKENRASRSSKMNGTHVSRNRREKEKENVLNNPNEIVIKIPKVSIPSTQNDIPSTSTGISRGSKFKIVDQYRVSEWLSETRPRKSPYYPQMGDEIVYFIQGHQLYLNAVEIKSVYEISTKDLPWNKMQIRDHEFVKVIGIQYEIKPPRLCCLKLALLDEEGRLTGKIFTVKYHDMPDVLDFFVLKQMYCTALSRDWQPGDKFRCMIDDEWWVGQIICKSPASDQFPESAFMCYEICWTNGEQERMSPWDMEQIDLERLPEDESQSIPVLDHELTSILYKTVPSDWPNSDRETITEHIVIGITRVMELAIAEPFLVPVDINVYPAYAMVIEYPIDLSTIKARFENNFYRRLTAAQFDIRYLAKNAEKFNERHSVIVRHARILTELCLRIVKNCADYIDVPSIYRQLVDTYDSSDTEEEVDLKPSSSRSLRTLPARTLKNASDWKIEAKNLIDALWNCEDSIPFRSPVNPVKYPDYRQIVKNPMDLGTVKENLKNGKYKVPQEFCIDMRLIFQNSRLYNTNKRSRIYVMTVRLSAIFEEHMEKIIHNWKMAKRKQNRRRNKVSSSDSEVSVTTGPSHSSDDEVKPEQLTAGSQEDESEEDDMPLNILRSKQNTTESDSTSLTSQSQSLGSKIRVKIKRTPESDDDEYCPAYTTRKRPFKTSSDEDEEEEEDEELASMSFSDEEIDRTEQRKSLRQRPVKKKILLYESSDSETNLSFYRKPSKVIKNSDSDSDSKSSRTTMNNDRSFISSVSSRGRVRKLTERAKAMFEKR